MSSKRISQVIYVYEDGTSNTIDIPDLKKIPTLTEVANNQPTWTPTPLPQPTWYGSCPTCGIQLNKVMGYVCGNQKCPTGLAPVYSGVGQ